MIDYSEIPYQSDDWELFARDFFAEQGFTIESPPDRGPDGGKDMLILETVKGKLHHYTFRWLVSCKHFVTSGKAVNESKDEQNILERLESFRADGFIGFYSTIASSGLNSRLRELRKAGKIRDYQIFDRKRIEDQMLKIGFSRTFSRYFPESAKNLRPLHKIIDEYVPVTCEACGKDLLESLYHEEYQGLVASVEKLDSSSGIRKIEKIYFSCKGTCDRNLGKQCLKEYGILAKWKDLSDLVIPADFLHWILASLNQLNSGKYEYAEEAFEKEKQLIIALSQKVFREMTENERARVRDPIRYDC